ncbi:DUF6367 family protein [Acinetobacter sp. 161(2023)]|uniref:DUF6367 family protein n=1 Tax=Acinetobacter sp. 161(2023) TaxID=3098768 RepID=UPI0030085FBB
MQLKNQHSTLQYLHISIPEILLGHIKSKNSWQSYDQEWSYRLDPPHASHPFQRDLYIIKSKNIEKEDTHSNSDDISIKNSENIEAAKKIIKQILDLSNNISIENWLEDIGNRSIIKSMIDKNKIKLMDIH